MFERSKPFYGDLKETKVDQVRPGRARCKIILGRAKRMDLLFNFDRSQQSSGLYLMVVLGGPGGAAVNVSKHRKEGREDGRTPLPREMPAALFVPAHTHNPH